MDLAFTPEEDAYRHSLRAWLADNLPEGWGAPFSGPEDLVASARLRQDWEQNLYRAGYNGVHWPKAYGGQGLSYLHHLIVSEELGRVAAPEPVNIAGMELAGPLILAVGSEEQKRRFLPPIVAGKELWCQGFSEPNAGSDLASLTTSALRDGDHWVINGQKIWTSYAIVAQMCFLLARTDRDAPRHKGITMFLVPMGLPGIIVKPLEQINGRSEFSEVFFEDVRIPGDANLGPVNEGWRVANEVLAVERGTNRLYRQARFQNEFEQLLALALATPELRARVVEDGWFRQRLADVYALLRIHRYHNLKMISRMDAGERIGVESSFIKLFWSEMHQKLGQLAMDVLGADAALEDACTYAQGRYQEVYFTSRATTIYAGTAQVQRNIIAERLLGLPR
ncbi:MAG: acyl-CoA dehydrogenase [Sphingomicrobium sp.]